MYLDGESLTADELTKLGTGRYKLEVWPLFTLLLILNQQLKQTKYQTNSLHRYVLNSITGARIPGAFILHIGSGGTNL